MTEKPIENAATREARKRGAEGAFKPSMTADERREAERVWKEANRAYDVMPKITDNIAAYMAAVDIIAAARVRWQNEALEEAAKVLRNQNAMDGVALK